MLHLLHLFLFIVLVSGIYGQMVYFAVGGTDCVKNPGGLVVAPRTACKKFLLCDRSGLAFGPIDCSASTLFDEKKKHCAHVEDVSCTEDINVISPGCRTAAVPNNCRRYTQCVNDIQYWRYCANGTVYSNFKRICVHPETLTREENSICGFKQPNDYIDDA